MNPKTAIIILNWNGWQDTIECLESLYRITYPNYDVIVVDNGSEDESIEKIKEYAEGKIEVESKFFEYDPSNKPIKIIEYTREEAEAGGGKEKEIDSLPSNRKMIIIKNEKNYGFAEGNNIGMRYTLKTLNSEYVLLLNNDTVVDKKFIEELVKVAESDKKIGIVGPKTYYYDYNGRSDVISFTGASLNLWKLKEYRYGYGEIDKGQLNNKKMEVDKIEGSCMLLKRKVLQEAGLFDPDYFTYWEETDLCFRAAKKGFKLLYAQRAKIWHKEAASTGGTLSSHYIYYMTRNQFLFMKKNATKSQLFSFLVYFLGFQFWFISGIYIYNKNINIFISFLRGVIDGLKSFQ